MESDVVGQLSLRRFAAAIDLYYSTELPVQQQWRVAELEIRNCSIKQSQSTNGSALALPFVLLMRVSEIYFLLLDVAGVYRPL